MSKNVKPKYVKFTKSTTYADADGNVSESYETGDIVEFKGKSAYKAARWLKRVYCEEATAAEYKAQQASTEEGQPEPKADAQAGGASWRR